MYTIAGVAPGRPLTEPDAVLNRDVITRAPSLNKGLALLHRLNWEGAANQETLVRASGWPKASVRRLLHELARGGFVRRDPSTRMWHALVRLEATPQMQESLRERMLPHLAGLAAASRAIAELWCPDGGVLGLLERIQDRQAGPTMPRARIGMRHESSHFGCLMALWAARGGQTPPRPHWNRRPLSAAAVTALTSAASDGVMRDPSPNLWGVLRTAAAIPDALGSLAGIVAIAQVEPPPGSDLRPLLRRMLEELDVHP